ncbi:Uncharacterised protein [Mycobacteroides abscessus subsp. abscessus]|nr:Uncharacterised protein [Mycobacteroides abscessus subsp. abscessus]
MHSVAWGHHALRVDLQPDHPNIGPDCAQPSGQLQRGIGHGAVPEVDHQRITGARECRLYARVMNEPAVAAAQAIDTGGAAGDGAARAGGGCHDVHGAWKGAACGNRYFLGSVAQSPAFT